MHSSIFAIYLPARPPNQVNKFNLVAFFHFFFPHRTGQLICCRCILYADGRTIRCIRYRRIKPHNYRKCFSVARARQFVSILFFATYSSFSAPSANTREDGRRWAFRIIFPISTVSLCAGAIWCRDKDDATATSNATARSKSPAVFYRRRRLDHRARRYYDTERAFFRTAAHVFIFCPFFHVDIWRPQ